MPALITGTGRCGTTWAVETLQDVGLDARHQWYRHEHSLGQTIQEDMDYDVEVSYEAAPTVNSDMWSTVTLLWRPALKVMNSWRSLGVFMPGWEEPYSMLYSSLECYLPEVLDNDYPGQAAQFWVSWNEMIIPHANNILCIEGLSPHRLLQALGYDMKPSLARPDDTNTKGTWWREVEPLVLEDLDSVLCDKIVELEQRMSDGC